jgi:hypothetical protein
MLPIWAPVISMAASREVVQQQRRIAGVEQASTDLLRPRDVIEALA